MFCCQTMPNRTKALVLILLPFSTAFTYTKIHTNLLQNIKRDRRKKDYNRITENEMNRQQQATTATQKQSFVSTA